MNQFLMRVMGSSQWKEGTCAGVLYCWTDVDEASPCFWVLLCLALPERKSSQTEPSQMGCSLLGPVHCKHRYRYLRGTDRGLQLMLAWMGWDGWMDMRNPGQAG